MCYGHHGPNPPPAHGGVHQPTFKIFCKANEEYCLTAPGRNVVLAPANPRDEHQHWYKDMRFSNQIKDEEGNPAFALVNKATGLAIKHSLGQSHPVKLVPFNPDYQDESVLWTESGDDVGKGFRCIRMVNNISLIFHAFHGYKRHGGTAVVLWEWAKGDNQSWKIRPLDDEAYAAGGSVATNAPYRHGGGEPTVGVCWEWEDDGFSVSVCLEPDEYLDWEDEDGYPAFAPANRVTGEAIKHSQGEGHPVKLVPYNPNKQGESVLWTVDRGPRLLLLPHGRMVDNIHLNFGAFHGDKDHGGVRDDTAIVLKHGRSYNQTVVRRRTVNNSYLKDQGGVRDGTAIVLKHGRSYNQSGVRRRSTHRKLVGVEIDPSQHFTAGLGRPRGHQRT